MKVVLRAIENLMIKAKITQNSLHRTSTSDWHPSNCRSISNQLVLQSIPYFVWLPQDQRQMRLASIWRIRLHRSFWSMEYIRGSEQWPKTIQWDKISENSYAKKVFWNTYSQWIARGHKKCFSANDHVAITVTIKCSTHVVITTFNCID